MKIVIALVVILVQEAMAFTVPQSPVDVSTLLLRQQHSRTGRYSLNIPMVVSYGSSSDDDMMNVQPEESTPIADMESSSPTSSSRAMELGFDKPQQKQPDVGSNANQSMMQQEKLLRSLDDSAKFKIRNDARFTWLALFLVSAAYGYSCFNPQLGYLELLGLPDGGLVGGASGAFLALTSLILFFLPELFRKK